MKPRHQVSRVALELIKSFEGFRETAAQLPDGRWTIGHGHTRTARQGARVSTDDARDLLSYDLLEVTAALNASVFAPLTQNQVDALASFVFNVGLEGFRGSTVLRRLNEGELLKGAFALELWRKAEFEGEVIVIDALVRRRAAEKNLFLTPADGFIAAPTPLLRPRLDEKATDYAPARTPVEIVPSLQGDQVSARRADPPLIAQPMEDAPPSLTELAGGGAPAASSPAQLEPDPIEPFPALALDRSPEPAAYDGVPTSAPSVADESPLPPSPLSTQAQASAGVMEPTVDELAAVADEPDAEPSLVHAPDVSTNEAASAAVQPDPRRKLILTGVLGVVGVILFGVGIVAVYRGRYENNGTTGLALAIGIAGILCLAAVLYILMDNPGSKDD